MTLAAALDALAIARAAGLDGRDSDPEAA